MVELPTSFDPTANTTYFFKANLLKRDDPESSLVVGVYEHFEETIIVEYVLWLLESNRWQDVIASTSQTTPSLETTLDFLEEMGQEPIIKNNWRLLYGLIDLQLTIKEELASGKE